MGIPNFFDPNNQNQDQGQGQGEAKRAHHYPCSAASLDVSAGVDPPTQLQRTIFD